MILGQLKIRLYGDPCLRVVSKPVAQVGIIERMLIASLRETMHGHKGVGLAAPQVGVNERIFVVDTGKVVLVAINPRLISGQGRDVMEEGCLSIPQLSVNVPRYKVVDVFYVDENGQEVTRTLTGLAAKAFQHELDHLDGKLIVDYIEPKARQAVLAQIVDGIYRGKS